MNTNPTTDPCPCGSQDNYAECCGLLHSGKQQAATAEALMRARYSAFVVEDENYLLQSWHSSTRPERVLENDTQHTEWKGLNVIECHAGAEGDRDGTVEFIARFTVHKQAGQIHEVSKFMFEDDRWFYLDGEAKKGITATSEKIGRNEPCPCGSGKKYKKCCGK